MNKPNPIKWIKREILIGEYEHVIYPSFNIEYLMRTQKYQHVRFDGQFFYAERLPLDKVEVHGKFRSFWKRLFYGK